MGRMGSLETLERLQLGEADRERRPVRREVAEIWRDRVDLLGTEDRVLLKAYLEAQSSFDEMARLTGRDRSSMCRRIHRILRRLADETYDRCQGGRFSAEELTVIRDHFVRGLRLTQICRGHHLGYRRVRTLIARARTFAQATKTC
jgi:DNA-directed RNA polymerase specialized sigma24 family protein